MPRRPCVRTRSLQRTSVCLLKFSIRPKERAASLRLDPKLSRTGPGYRDISECSQTQASLDERGNRHEIQATDAGPDSFSNSKDHCSAKVEPRSGIGPATVLLSSLSTGAQRLHGREIQSTACLLSSEPATRTGSGIAGLSHLRARSHKTCFEQGGNNQALEGKCLRDKI
jgi:hypothetical protein